MSCKGFSLMSGGLDSQLAVRVLQRAGAEVEGICFVTPFFSPKAAEQAAELGIRIFTIAIGRDERISRYTADVDTFDSKTLKNIAHMTGGKYYHASSGEKLQRAFDHINRLEKTEATRRTLVSYEELLPYPLALAALLLALGFALHFTLPRPAP